MIAARDTVDVDGAKLTVVRWGDGRPEIALLHDGLGSIEQWRSIPGEVARRTGRTVLAYDRPGHGASTPVPAGAWPADWLHRETDRLARFLDVCGIEGLLLVGHSDGGSIALLHAAARPGSLRGVLTLAAHSWVERKCYEAIAAMRADPDPIVAGLARSHAHPEALFEAWSGVWVSDAFRPWDIRPLLGTIDCPTLVAQGRNDEYAPDTHVDETVAAIGANATGRLLDDVGHLMHHQDPELVIDTIVGFVTAAAAR